MLTRRRAEGQEDLGRPGERSRTWGSHHGVPRASGPAEAAGGQGPLAIKESLEVVRRLLVPGGLNIYRGEAARCWKKTASSILIVLLDV